MEPNVTRPEGLQVWNSPSLRTDFALDFGDPCETLRPVVICGARNGAFSEKVVLGSTKPIRGLKATLGGLQGPGGTIPASRGAIALCGCGRRRVRDVQPTLTALATSSGTQRTATWADALVTLLDAPPAEYEVVRCGRPRMWRARRGVFGAVAPVWMTVRVPADAKPGVYEGKLIGQLPGREAGGSARAAGGGRLDAARPRQLPDLGGDDPVPGHAATGIRRAAWSDKHFELIARSFRLIREVGSGVLYLPLICCTHYGNEESMVRWVKKGENEYDFDFTVMDNYLDVAEKNLGQPKLVCFLVWEPSCCPRGTGGTQ